MTDPEPTRGVWDPTALFPATDQPTTPITPPSNPPPLYGGQAPAPQQPPPSPAASPAPPLFPAPTPAQFPAATPAPPLFPTSPPAPGPFPAATPAPPFVTAPAPRGHGKLPLIVAGMAVLLAVVAGGGALLLRSQNQSTDTAGPAPEPVVTTEAVSTEPTAAVSTDPAATSEAPADPQAEAIAGLEELRAQDLATVTPAGQFVAQIASKHPGIEDPLQTAADGTHVFQAADILAEHQRLREAHSDTDHPVIVLKSTDYGKRQLIAGQPLWVTFAVGDFPDKQSVLDWCATHFSDLSGDQLQNQCDVRTLRPPL